LKEYLSQLVHELNLNMHIDLVGYVNNPFKYYKNADVFVLSSYVEGLPNVLVEAMMCGCTPVSTDCPTGPREVIQNNKYGYLVPVKNPQLLAAGVINALENPISKDLLDEAIKPFSADNVIKSHFSSLNLTIL
jgi:glycosyltransferase involved in cell wall biosynthesis